MLPCAILSQFKSDTSLVHKLQYEYKASLTAYVGRLRSVMTKKIDLTRIKFSNNKS